MDADTGNPKPVTFDSAAPPSLTLLQDRRILAVSGPERRSFLQGLITNDIERLAPETGLFAALLTPQGKFLFDFLLAETGESILIDCERARSDDLQRRLMLYKLRAKVEIDFLDDWAVAAVFGATSGAPEGGIAFADPRHPEMGRRILAPADAIPAWAEATGLGIADTARYHAHRLKLGIPEGAADLGSERTLALEGNLDLLKGVDFEKGCYVGQELTARTHYRGKVRYRLYPVDIAGDAPPAGSDILKGDKKVGTLLSSSGSFGLARLRSEDLDGTPLSAGDATLTARRLPEDPA